MAEPHFNVLWLQSGGCGGCSMSLLCSDTADFAAQLRQLGIHLLWHPSLSLESGHELLALLAAVLDGSLRLDVIEAMLLRETLLRHRWNKTRAAQELGLSRVGLRGKMQRLGLEK